MSKFNPATRRLLSLDALRGFDMIWLLGAEGIFKALLVLTGWSIWHVFAIQFEHSKWHGLTFYDLIFPLFIFLSGVTLGIANKSLIELPFNIRLPIYRKALIRVLILCFLGVIYNHGWGQGMPASFEKIRYASVLMRIALAWFFCALIVWHCHPKIQWLWAGVILVGYWILLMFIPTPAGHIGQLSIDTSWNSWIDQHLLPGITYRALATDPEGLLSHIPAIVNALAGAFVGRLLMSPNSNAIAVLKKMLVASILCLIAGYTWGIIFPINKTLWTSSFVLLTVGWSTLLLAVFYWLIDVLHWRSFGLFFAVIGSNAILLYLGTSIVNWNYLNQSLFGGLLQSFSDEWQGLISIILLVTVQWLLARFLYVKKIFLKV